METFLFKNSKILNTIMTQNNTSESEDALLPHHEQLDLCTSRLPYRQGRKLTAVKVYSINNESKHLLVFGVPSLNLRQETKALFSRFGKLTQFNITKYPCEQFTETYHALYEDIQSSRIAKKMLDTKNYYGGNLHVCYAPELETIHETKEKLLQRQKNVISRLKNLQRSTMEGPKSSEVEIKLNVNSSGIIQGESTSSKIYMGAVNNIQLTKRKFKETKPKKLKKTRNIEELNSNTSQVTEKTIEISKPVSCNERSSSLEIIDFTSVEREVITNINEGLNYNNFGQEIVKPVPYKPVNKIKFNVNKSS